MMMNPRNKQSGTRLSRNTSFLSILLVLVIFMFINMIRDMDAGNQDAGQFQVTFINVGQGDSILIKNPQNEFMLIDTGSSEQYGVLKAHLDSNNIEKFEYVIFTHPHADHIGSADKIIKEYDVGTLIMPRVTHDTMTFVRLLEEIEAKRMGITPAEAGTEYIFGDAKFFIVAPLKEEYSNINDYSVVIKMIYGINTFLFTGDIEKTSEEDIIAFCESQGENIIVADVLKAAHHGSSSSSSQKFLDLVKPKIAVILSDGKSYGHPHLEVIERLSDIDAVILRSDLHGNIIISSNGRTLNIETEILPP